MGVGRRLRRGASPEIQWGCRSDLCQYTKIYVNLRFFTKFRKGNLTPVKFSFSTIFDIFRRLLLRERDWNQGGILAGGDFGVSQNTTARPLMEGHGSPWATPKQPQLFGPAARRGPLKFGRVQGPFSKGRLVAVRRQRNSLPAAAAAGVDGRYPGRELALGTDHRRGNAPFLWPQPRLSGEDALVLMSISTRAHTYLDNKYPPGV